MSAKIEVKFKMHTSKLDKITKTKATDILENIANNIIADADNLAPKRMGNLRDTGMVYELEGTPDHVVTVVASYGRGEDENKQYFRISKRRGLVYAAHPREYAIPQHLGAPEGNPVAWGHLTKLKYTTKGTKPKYLSDVFDQWVDKALKELADRLLK
jgi:hypothetical protein